MASQILASASNIAEKAKEMTSAKNTKIVQLAADTKDVNDKSWRITSDYGVKQNNTDEWLKVASDAQQGPQLLEDHFGREKVSTIHTVQLSLLRNTIMLLLHNRYLKTPCILQAPQTATTSTSEKIIVYARHDQDTNYHPRSTASTMNVSQNV